MIFQHTIDKVLSGEKTQTRRIVKPGEQSFVDDMDDDIIACVTSNTGRVKWEVNKTYSVQPGRGKPAVARIQITSIRREDVREISYRDAVAEGFLEDWDFMMTWVRMHDKAIWKIVEDRFEYWNNPAFYHPDYAPFTDIITNPTKTRPDERYQAWVLTFKVVQE